MTKPATDRQNSSTPAQALKLSVVSDPFVLHSDHIDRAIAAVCRRHGLSPQDAEDFGSDVRLYLLDRDRAVLRAFQGRSSIATYLIAVVVHRLQDWRNARWGKWRPSVEAKRMGPLAVRLETMMMRDGMTLDTAYEMLRSHGGITQARADLEAIVARFPRRAERIQVSDDVLDHCPTQEKGADARLEASHAENIASRAASKLRSIVRNLSAEDRLLIRMRFDDSLRVSDISRVLAVDQKALYRRFDRLLAHIRASLEQLGITPADAEAILTHGGFDRLPQDRLPELRA